MGVLTPMTKADRPKYLKAGFFGFEGSGKTLSAALTAIGLHRKIESKKPIAFYDTEKGLAYLEPLLEYAKIPVLKVVSRSLKDLGQFIKEAKDESDIAIIDSLTHPYKELLKSYIRYKKNGAKFISFQDWQPIKDAWNEQFAEPYTFAPLHLIWCSRAKNIFDEVIDIDASEKARRDVYKTVQTGTGARSESESSYEPSLLVEFTREMATDDEKISKEQKKSALYHRRATVIKDRFMLLDGIITYFETPRLSNGKIDLKKMVDENPTYQFFSQHIERLDLGKNEAETKYNSSEELFSKDDISYEAHVTERTEREILLEEIKNELTRKWPASQGQDKVNKLNALKEAFGTDSWTAIEKGELQFIKDGHKKIVPEQELIDFDEKQSPKEIVDSQKLSK